MDIMDICETPGIVQYVQCSAGASLNCMTASSKSKFTVSLLTNRFPPFLVVGCITLKTIGMYFVSTGTDWVELIRTISVKNLGIHTRPLYSKIFFPFKGMD